MSNKAIFGLILVLIFVSVLSIGLTLIFKDQSDKAMEVFGGGAFVSIFVIIMGLGFLFDSED